MLQTPRQLASLLLLAIFSVLASPALAQDRYSVQWNDARSVDPQASLLQHHVVGVPGSASATAWIAEARGEHGRTRYTATLDRNGYIGTAQIIQQVSGQGWSATTANSAAKIWRDFGSQNIVPVTRGRNIHGRTEFLWIIFEALVDGDRRSCSVYTASHQRWGIDGYVCAPVGIALTAHEAVGLFRSIGFRFFSHGTPVALRPSPNAPVMPAATLTPPPEGATPATPEERLATLRRMREAGQISQREHDELRRIVLDGVAAGRQ